MCHNHILIYSYCFKAIFSDGTSTISIPCFSNKANTLTKDCDQVLPEIEHEDRYQLPPSQKELEGTKHIFQFHFDTGITAKRPDFVLDKVIDINPLPLPGPSVGQVTHAHTIEPVTASKTEVSTPAAEEEECTILDKDNTTIEIPKKTIRKAPFAENQTSTKIQKINKSSLGKVNTVLTPKDKGGLGVSSLFALNRGLMLKWVWRFYSQKCSLWTKVIKAIYGEDGNLNKDVSGGVRTCWTSIVHEVRVLQGRGINVADYIRLKLGNGENTRFWVDNWYEGGVIKELFPRMFALDELNNKATGLVQIECVKLLDNSFRRKARSGIEEMQLNSLAEISRMTTLVPCEDRYVWTLESDGVFSVASIRKEIDGNHRFSGCYCRLGGIKIQCQSKVKIMSWKSQI
ncbi:hypothetical protein Tco_0393964 [Tanacetum coccineum]